MEELRDNICNSTSQINRSYLTLLWSKKKVIPYGFPAPQYPFSVHKALKNNHNILWSIFNSDQINLSVLITLTATWTSVYSPSSRWSFSCHVIYWMDSYQTDIINTKVPRIVSLLYLEIRHSIDLRSLWSNCHYFASTSWILQY